MGLVLHERIAPHIDRVTLNNEKALNAYNLTMCRELLAAFAAFSKDDTARVLILTGAGRAFCSGGDLHAQDELDMGSDRILGHAAVMREGIHQVVLTMQRLEKPVIAQVNGPAISGGLALAMMCDLRIASDRARLGDASGKFGLLPDEGGLWIWPQYMGLENALKMTLLSEIYDAETAREKGLVGSVVPHDKLEAAVLDLADKLAACSPLVVRTVKRVMRRGLSQTLENTLGEIELAVEVVNHSADANEGIEAFRQKRPAVFQGR